MNSKKSTIVSTTIFKEYCQNIRSSLKKKLQDINLSFLYLPQPIAFNSCIEHTY